MQEALRLDVFSFEAFDRLTAHHLMRAEEEEELLDAIPLADQCVSEEEQELVRFLYNSMTKKVMDNNSYANSSFNFSFCSVQQTISV